MAEGSRPFFRQIRRRLLKSSGRNEKAQVSQYSFEEACLKTFYNETDCDDPFDRISPYWVVPAAINLARAVGIDAMKVIEVVA